MVALVEIPNGCAGWHPFGRSDDHSGQAQERGGVKLVNAQPGNSDRSGSWLRNATLALAVLAAAAAAVSWDAQYVMVASVKHTPAIAALDRSYGGFGA